LHFSDAIICLISSALVGGNVHKLGKGSMRKSLKVARGGSVLEDTFLPILEKFIFSSSQWWNFILPLETKKTTIFAKNVKIQGETLLAPPSDAHAQGSGKPRLGNAVLRYS